MRKNFSGGVTLLEMMSAITISMLLILSLTRIYMNMHRLQASQHAMQVQHNHALRLIDIIRDEIGAAGHIGCARLSNDFIVNPLPPYSFTIQNFLTVNANKLTLRYQAFPGVVLLHDMHGQNMLTADASVRYQRGDILVISDCSHAEIFQTDIVVMRANFQIIYPKIPLQHQYRKFSEIGSLVIHQYYVDARHTLMRRELDGRNNEIMTGIDAIAFSRDEGGVRIGFQTVDAVSRQNWHGYAAIK